MSLEKLKTLHDKIKENPYWLNFDTNFLIDLIEDFKELVGSLTYNDKNAYDTILRACTHDMYYILRNLTYWAKWETFKFMRSDIILVLQTFLSNVHCLIDNIESTDGVIGYGYGNGELNTYYSKWSDNEQKYKILNVISTKQKFDRIIRYLKACAESSPKYTKAWAVQCLNDIENKQEIVGDHFMIKESLYCVCPSKK